ncbi:hypothetical protein JCM17380_00980 [Desulfosporosinus burensis]
MLKVDVAPEAARYIQSKGGEIIIFRGTLSGCCGGTLPSPDMELGHPRRPLDNYCVENRTGITLYIDNELSAYNGRAEVTLGKNLWWSSLSFKYYED